MLEPITGDEMREAMRRLSKASVDYISVVLEESEMMETVMSAAVRAALEDLPPALQIVALDAVFNAFVGGAIATFSVLEHREVARVDS